MTQLELLASKIRGADNLEDAADIIADWYDGKVKHARTNAYESADIVRRGITPDFLPGYVTLFTQVASNFEATAKMLEFDRGE